ncbi:MAG: hypothetical protein KGH58_01530 [Candidatus Micrarchaeota archaeon]|nr:hypothetical protein [Candidatus Micrarchaeota archaeon]
MDKNVVLYIGIAIVAVAVVLVAALVLYSPNYDLSVKLVTNSTQPVYPYQTAYFGIVLANKGSAVSNLVVGFYVNGAEQSYSKVSIPAGKTVAVETNYTFTSNGPYQFSAVADPAHVLPIKDRNATSYSMGINVSQAEQANIFTSIPNRNITYTQSFSFANAGFESSSAIADRYNITMFNQLFAIPQQIVTKVAENMFPTTAYANGAYATYANGTAAYTLWMQGVEGPQDVQYVASTFQVPSTTFAASNRSIIFMRTSNTTSMCASYDQGWTKIVSYFNASNGSTCAGMASASFQPTEANVLVQALKANPDVPVYRARFTYTNTTLVGSTISYSNSTFGVSNMFYNSYGFFTSVIQANPSFNSSNSTRVCRGLAYANGTTNVCSTYMVPRGGLMANGYALINSTQIGSRYLLQLFSLVNQTAATTAHVNGVSLIRALNISQNTTRWGSAFTNYCKLLNTSIGCGVEAYDYANNTASLNFTNRFSAPITVNHVACYVPGLALNATINYTVGVNQSVHLRVTCSNIPIPVASPSTSYLLLLNYTYGGSMANAYGYVNVTNPGFG